MRSLFLLIGIVLLLLFASCGGSSRVMDTGFLQKRKHLPGWDLSIGKKAGPPTIEHQRLAEDPPPINLSGTPVGEDDHSLEEITASVDPVEDHMRNSTAQTAKKRSKPTIGIEISTEEVGTKAIDPQQDLMPKKKWNKFAIPAFVAALGVVYLGLFSTSTIAVIVAIGITFILSGISLRQIRSRDEAGKGFALIALIIALLASIATAMVTYVVGFI